MSTVTGILANLLGIGDANATIEVALCGYANRVPRLKGAALAARLTDNGVTIASDGKFSFTLTGNDLILPEGTYYTVTVKDESGDIAQVNAYRFADDQDYDLNSTDTIDPNQG